MSETLVIYGASDDLIEAEGLLREELNPPYGKPVVVSVYVDDARYASVEVEYDPDGSGEWRIQPTSLGSLVTITRARGDDEPADEDGCPGYSDKAVIDMRGIDARRVNIRTEATPVIRPMGYYGPRLNDARHIATFDPPTVLALLARLEAAESARDEALAALEAGDACGAVGCRALAERDEALAAVERVRALAQQAVVRIGGSHTHWREGGAGGVCQTCESQRQTQADFQARLDALTPSAPTEEPQA